MEEANQTCPNCKRDIPAVNFVTHSLHCTRNIKICAVCKEPVPQSELEEHNEKLHKLMPCKRCGDMVRGTDLEDHVRDSCAFTMQSCRFCSLELQRREVPTHERYCGARTEQCAECGEWVMLRYRQLHVDSNHGFVRLDDDSLPRPNRALGTPPANVGTRAFPRLSDLTATQPDRFAETRAEQRVRAPLAQPETSALAPAMGASKTTAAEAGGVAVRAAETAVPRASSNTRHLKRTNDQPQINMNVTTKDKAQKNLGVSRGAVKKRPAPRPPAPAPSPDPRRDMPYYSALQRRQDEDRKRREQNALNLALGLPPVLDPAAKLEKLRKMDELHNREIDSTDYKNKLQGRVWQNSDVASAWQANGEGASGAYVNGKSANVPQDATLSWQRSSLRDLKPMSPEEFVVRFEKLRCRDPAPRDIRSSLRELRRGLNEVTAPYNNNNTNCNDANCSRTAGDTGNKNNSRQANANNMHAQTNHTAEEEEVPLPCQFCSETFKVDDLLSHESVCGQAGVARALADDDPIIPCEFCGRPMPYYLIGEHQELCDREVNQLYPD